MKFVYDGKMWAQESVVDKMNSFSDYVVGKEFEIIFKPVGNFFMECLSNLGHWVLVNLPDLMGYATVGAGVLIILTGMLGKANVTKTMSWYAGLFIVAITVLGGAK